MTAPARAAVARAGGPLYSPAYLNYALGLLCLIYVVNFVDRQILSILLQSIKVDLGLTDSQLGLLSGTAFGIFYATLGIPIARLADRFSRKGVIAICLAIWSGMTALCGTASGFAALLLYRIGVGVGEAGGSPPAHSMISDYFPPERRATALGIFALGVPFGILVGFLAGGWLDEVVGWRRAFIIVGAPGLVLALVTALTLREPARGHSEGLSTQGESPSAGAVMSFLFASPTFRNLSTASALNAFAGYAAITWTPAFLIRSHGMSSGEVGTALALAVGIGGGLGNYLGGVFADRWAWRDVRGRLFVPAVAMAVVIPFGGIYVVPSAAVAVPLVAVSSFLTLMYQAPAFAVTQFLATPLMRATAAAVLLFVINIVGLGLGPLVTGMLSDALTPRLGDDALRYALLFVHMSYGVSGLFFWRASRTLVADLERVKHASSRELA